MNKLYLIGNGFDLAHGLKTSYSDFLLWYINKSINQLNSNGNGSYTDDLISIETTGYAIEEFESIASFRESLKTSRLSFQSKNFLFHRIIDQIGAHNWVDIEYEYYLALVSLYRKIEKHNTTKYDGADRLVYDLNNGLEVLKKLLIEYLQTIKNQTINKTIESRFRADLRKINKDKVLFLVFNYTSTIEQYVEILKLNSPPQVIYIHGKLGDSDNPIIFGYGDEMDDYYQKIENLNQNDLLKHMKAFSYLKTQNYANLSRFIVSNEYIISVMGHSCGLSDRVLLNSIFCSPNCHGIRIFYYKRDENYNDFFEKTQEISRHFTPELKNRMRNIITPFSDSISLT